MTEVNKMQLINPSKLNEILDLIKSDHENQKLLQGINNKSDFELIESKNKMHEEMQKVNNNQRVAESMVSFLKRQQNMKKKKYEGENEVPDDTAAAEATHAIRRTPTVTSVKQIKEFLEKKKIKLKDTDVIKINGERVNHHDLLYDLSHNVSKQSVYNLTLHKQSIALKELKKLHMPAHYIRNVKLRHRYVNLGKNTSASKESLFPTPSPSQIPQPTPPTTPSPYSNSRQWRRRQTKH